MVPELLFDLTVPAVTYIVLLIMRELKIFKMIVVIVVAGIVALFERLKTKYEQAIKEIDEVQITPTKG
jgi:hypothetical protein